MQVDIWSDVVCPWCAIGKRRFEAALAGFTHRDAVRVRWRSFELDPGAPRERAGTLVEHLAAKYGMSAADARGFQDRMQDTAAADGWAFDLDRARGGNTFDAHRLVHLGADRGRQDAVKEALLRAYLTEGEPIGEPAALERVALGAGLDAAEVGAVLDGDRYADAVRADEAAAARLGISGVPFFVLDGRYGVSGAQPVDVLTGVLGQVWERSTGADPAPGADGCAGSSCAV